MQKKALTLLEIIIVIFLITLITGAVGYSMKGTLDKGRAFRTEQAQEQLHDLFVICLAEGESSEDILHNPEGVLKKYNLAKSPKKLLEDGWGKKFDVAFVKGDFRISSSNLVSYNKKMNKTQDEEE